MGIGVCDAQTWQLFQGKNTFESSEYKDFVHSSFKLEKSFHVHTQSLGREGGGGGIQVPVYVLWVAFGVYSSLCAHGSCQFGVDFEVSMFCLL